LLEPIKIIKKLIAPLKRTQNLLKEKIPCFGKTLPQTQPEA
jgi:hypothetical protein